MGSYWAAYYGQGLVLTGAEFMAFLDRYEAVCTDGKTKEDILEFRNGEIDISEVAFHRSIAQGGPYFFTCADKDTCSGFHFIPYRMDGRPNDEWDAADLPEQDMYILDADKAIDGMDCFEERAYASYDDFLDEFKGKLSACLPHDFDWEGHVGIYSYACYA